MLTISNTRNSGYMGLANMAGVSVEKAIPEKSF